MHGATIRVILFAEFMFASDTDIPELLAEISRAGYTQAMPATVRCNIFCLPVCYLTV